MEQFVIINLSAADIEWLRDNYPSLKISQEDQAIRLQGLLGFGLYFEPSKPQLIYNPPAKYHSDKYLVKDVYKIQIKFLRNGNSILPQVREIGGRLESFSKKSGINMADLHVQPNGTLCLCPRQEEERRMPSGLDLDILFSELIIPFFYSHSFFEKYNNRPWKDYSHGTLGTLEYYARSYVGRDLTFAEKTLVALEENYNLSLAEYYSQLLRSIIKLGKAQCPCESGKKFKDCHKEAFEGLKKLISDAEYFRIDLI